MVREDLSVRLRPVVLCCLCLILSSLAVADLGFAGFELVSLTPGAEGIGQGSSALRPLALAAGDFDEDGVPDLVASHTGTGAGLKLYRGNHDAIFPFSTAARERAAAGLFHASPFHGAPQTLASQGAYDLLAAGDFDADGHLDLLATSRGSSMLEMFRGDGKGGLALERSIEVDGSVTAMIVGEVNRRDGLADLVVGVDAGSAAELLVFEGADGALGRAPERIALPVAAAAIALGELDGLPGRDIAVAAGTDLIFVHGRDRKLSLDSQRQASVEPVIVDRQLLDARIVDLAFGNFVLDAAGKRELAAHTSDGRIRLFQGRTEWVEGRVQTSWQEIDRIFVDADVSPGAGSRLVPVRQGNGVGLMVVDPAGSRLHLVAGGYELGTVVEVEPGSSWRGALPMRLNADGQTDLVLSREAGGLVAMITQPEATITVDSTADNTTSGDGSCTLREAIINANDGGDASGGDCAAGTAAGADTIEFNIGGGGSTATIAMSDALPDITDTLTINGNTQCGSPPCVELDGSGVPDPGSDDLNGIAILAGASVVRGLVMTGWPDDAIECRGLVGGSLIEGNHIGVGFDGSTADGNANQGVQLFSPDNTVGGTTAAARNVISSQTAGGAVQAVNFDPSVLVTDASGNTIAGNYLGTDSGGTVDLGNAQAGVYIYEASDNTVGGTAAGSANLIANNSAGVVIRQAALEDFDAFDNLVQGNLIGTDVSGTGDLGNDGDGVLILYTSSNTVGGTTAAARNVVSGNGRFGVLVTNDTGGLTPTENNLVQGNFVGVDIHGTSDLGNTSTGVLVSACDDNTIGGAVAGAGNVISGNDSTGVYVGSFDGIGADGNSVQGNRIGTDATGAVAIGNDSTGIATFDATNTLIGGTDLAARNVISGNGFHGIHVQSASIGNTIQGNFIGTNAAGNAALANVESGIWIDGTSSDNLIGGPGSGPLPVGLPEGSGIVPPGNLISGNTVDGIQIYSGSPQNVIQGNYIGTDATGSFAIPNTRGVFSWFEGCFKLGGTGAGEGNLISGNAEYGVFPGNPNSGCVIQGNVIGLNASGTAAVPNGFQGILLKGTDHLVGGSVAGARNVISGNTLDGILLTDAVSANSTIAGNFIGTNAAGTQAVGNGSHGIIAIWDTSGHTIGGTVAGAGNVISGNAASGVFFGENNGGAGVRDITVAGNLIGTSADGLGAIPNSNGVDMGSDSHDNTIGGDTAAARNIISGNTNAGVYLSGTTTNNEVKNNYIGVGIDGSTPVANGDTGVIVDGVSGNQIGAGGAGNRIASNGSNGVYLANAGSDDNEVVGNEIWNNTFTGIVADANSGIGNTFSQNSIFGNGGFGIDLGADGVTANDDLDPDTGANNLQNFPVLTVVTEGSTNITGRLESLPNTQFTIEFFASESCDGSGFGEGQTYLDAIQVTTDASGDADIDATLTATAPEGDFVTATATAPDGSTSEFSQCVEVQDSSFIFGDGFEDGTFDAWSATVN